MTTYVTSDPRSSGLAAVVGASVLYVPAIGPTAGVATQLYKYGTGDTDWCTLLAGAGATPVTADPRTAGRAGPVDARVLYVTGGEGTLLYKYGTNDTAWCAFAPAASSSTVTVSKNGVAVGSRAVLNLIAGSGIAIAVTDTGSEIAITITAVTTEDWRLVTDSVSTSNDWGLATDSVGTSNDWGAV